MDFIDLVYLFIIFLFGVLLIKWGQETFKTSPLNINGVFDPLEESALSDVKIHPFKKEEKFNFFKNDAEIMLRGKYIDVDKIKAETALGRKAEENYYRLL